MDKLQIGDIVSVNFHASQYTLCGRAKLIYIPTCPGDNWIFEDENGLHYTNERCTVSKLYKEDKALKEHMRKWFESVQ